MGITLRNCLSQDHCNRVKKNLLRYIRIKCGVRGTI